MNKSLTRGFTLIELLVVIAIIGILSSVVLASLNSARQKGRDARRVSDMKQIQLALELYYDANNQVYPVTATWSGTGSLAAAVAPNYISTLPTTPSGTAYTYTSVNNASTPAACTSGTGCGASYVLTATMEGTLPTGAFTGTYAGVTCGGQVYCVRP